MQNNYISAKVTKTGIGTVNLNGFIYNVVKIDIAELKDFIAFIPVFAAVEEGVIFESTSWAVTCYRPDDETEILAIRVDQLNACDEYVPIKYLNAKVTGVFMNSDRCHVQYVGPTRRAFYRCTLKLRDEFGKNFSMLLCGFKDWALKLSTLQRLTIIQADVCIRRKKFVDGYELCINNFNVMDKEKES